jgi:hypothetical protein
LNYGFGVLSGGFSHTAKPDGIFGLTLATTLASLGVPQQAIRDLGLVQPSPMLSSLANLGIFGGAKPDITTPRSPAEYSREKQQQQQAAMQSMRDTARVGGPKASFAERDGKAIDDRINAAAAQVPDIDNVAKSVNDAVFGGFSTPDIEGLAAATMAEVNKDIDAAIDAAVQGGFDAYGPAPDPMGSFSGGLGTEAPAPGADAGSASPDASQADPGTASPGAEGSSSDPSDSDSGTDSEGHEPGDYAPEPTPDPPADGEAPAGDDGGEAPSGDPGGGGALGAGLPILLDLNGNGVRFLTASASNVTFDWDLDGYREKTAWADNADGVLVLDLNSDGTLGGDGKITRIDEIASSRWYPGAKTTCTACAWPSTVIATSCSIHEMLASAILRSGAMQMATDGPIPARC